MLHVFTTKNISAVYPDVLSMCNILISLKIMINLSDNFNDQPLEAVPWQSIKNLTCSTIHDHFEQNGNKFMEEI